MRTFSGMQTVILKSAEYNRRLEGEYNFNWLLMKCLFSSHCAAETIGQRRLTGVDAFGRQIPQSKDYTTASV